MAFVCTKEALQEAGLSAGSSLVKKTSDAKSAGAKSAGQDSPLPKARPGKTGITKLWTPGTPPRKPGRPQSLPDSANKPTILLRRGSKVSSEAKQSKEEGGEQGQVEADERPARSFAEKPADSVVREKGDLDWLAAYMEDGEASAEPQTAAPVSRCQS